LAGCLTGDFGHGDENNCLKLGYDPVARQWPAWLAELGVPIPWLPAVQPAGSRLGSISAAAHRATGLPAGLPVFAGTTDSVAAALAAGMAAPGDAVTSLGSTLALKILADRPVVSAAHGVYSHRLFDRWLAGGASNSGGAVLRAYFSAAEMAELTPRLQPQQPTGLDYYPLLRPGERFPVNDPGLRPRLTPRPADRLRFFQGLLEGIARIEQSAYGLLRQLGAPPPARVITTGGGAANRPWRQMRESLLGVPVVAAECTEAAVGAALLACRGAGGA
jgi:sugar (pentulose or hexulose) kinase